MGNYTQYKWLQVMLGFVLSRYISGGCVLPELFFPNGAIKLQALFYDDANQTVAEELSVLQFTCSAGFLLIGHEFIQCVDEEWTSRVPFCAGVKCPSPPLIENATHVIQCGANADLVVQSLAVYSCDDGLELENANASTLRCGWNERSITASWEGEKPVCKERKSCHDPGVPANGNRSGDCCVAGDTLSYSCDNGYELVGNWTLRCLRTAIWSSGRPLCRPLTDHCEFPPPIAHGVLTGRKHGDYFLAGDEARVLCEPGYKCEGKEFVVCQKGGTWRSEFGVCKEIFCDPPPPLEHGTIPELQTTNLTIFPNDFDITYACDDGYRIHGGDSFRTCGPCGWSGTTPRCKSLRCPHPGIPENGVKIGRNYSVGSRVRFKCHPEYQLLGSNRIYCQPNGQWTGELTRCNNPSNYCQDPGTPIKGFKNVTEYQMGDRVTFGCVTGYILLGSEVRECLPDTTWSGAETKCVGLYDFDTLEVKLPDKAEQQREEHRRFQEALNSSRGNGSSPFGRILDLNFTGRLILYFVFDVSRSITAPNFARSIDFAKAIVRKVGISPHGARAAALTISSKADVMFLPFERDSTQDVLDALDKIEYTGGGTAFSSVLSIIRLELMPLVREYLGEAKSTIFLFTDGKASVGEDPRQEAELLKAKGAEIYCFSITQKTRMEVLYDIASTSKYEEEMHPNVFILQDCRTFVRIVQKITNATVANYCPDPGTPINGFKNMTEYKMGDTVRFGCQPGNILLGSEVRECLPDTTWSGNETRCVGPNDFDSSEQVGDILRVKLDEEIELQRFQETLYSPWGNGSYPIGRMLDLNFPGRIVLYFAFDVSSSITLPNFITSIAVAKAIVKKVGISPHGNRAGALTFSSQAEIMFLPLNYDSTQDVLEALDRIEYTRADTSVSSVLNRIRLDLVPLMRQYLGEAKSVIFIFTDGKRNMSEDPSREAEILKANGAEIYCFGLTDKTRKEVLYDIASTSKYGEETRPNVFMLQDCRTLVRLVQEITSTTVDYSECGVDPGTANRGRIVGGKRSSYPWPWMAVLYKTFGAGDPQRQAFVCGGSVIHQHFVLTAAHCMVDKGRTLKSNEILVKLGLTNLRVKTYLQEIEVRKIYRHPRYSKKAVFDCDLALLELERPIEFNALVRPICLPPKEIPEDSQFYKPQSIAWAIGWGHEGVMPKYTLFMKVVMSSILKQAALPIQPRDVCIESLQDDHLTFEFTDNMFCAGEIGGKEDTCHGDSGGPVMQSQLKKDGYLTWVQVGIVSWGLGCGLKHEYGFYTHLQKVVEWINDTTETALKWMEE